MKKLNLFLLVAIFATFTFSSCKNDKPGKPTLKSQIDSLNYAFGVANGDGIKNYYLQGDSTGEALNSLLKGINDGLKSKVDKENMELASIGTQIGSSLKEQSKSGLMGDSSLTVNIDLVKQGLINGMKGSNIKMTPQEASGYLQSTMQSLQEKKMEKQYGANKEAGENFLRENAKKPGVITTPSGLQYEIIKKGNGPMPTDSSKVKVHYHGTLIDGTVFDSSVERNEPAEFYVNQVIKGWTEALKLMPVGSKFKIYVPYQLAYGSANQGKIKPFSMLIFEVELLSIEK
ncbi:MAG TPA: FKBP-type peptidyl-prolyl cis-trans isomerase [Paludibacteraceae bacterium]|jgi:FKBP-type peptidyl-prolyl cis-trans isomerase FklB|nr:FKBP-type peptidyl-prolyl cis-trans isomerase [Paludibacteraceae bacterium]HOH55953.1 FKBP-type peptidyl-prolyl cis-trans isomerase [Paludibacteraceae bacterium]